MARHLLETMSGTGAVHAGDVHLRTTRYELSFWADDNGSGDWAIVVDGRIDITGMAEATVLVGADALTLTLEDGRRLAIQLTSTSGGFVGRGWMPTVRTL